MSKDSVKKMFGKIEKDADLRKKYTEIINAHNNGTEKDLAAKLIELGKTSGFAFSKDDLNVARAEIMDAFNSNGELSDDDLDKVAGGGEQKALAIATSVISLGIACAVASIYDEATRKGACGATMSTTQAC